jgi:N-acetylglucosamine kinase-like BadF-type ATPase
LAAFARVVADAARLGDADAAAVLASAATALAELAATTIARLGAEGHEVRVAFTGGLVSNDAFRLRVHERLHALAPNALAVVPRAEPAVGAALLAFTDAGLAIPARVGVA